MQDGLAWRNPDSTWGGPVGEGIVRLIGEGYNHKFKPLHGYYFKYGVTGIQTFIVSHDDVVFQKNLGANTLEAFQAMTRYDPDPTWAPVEESE